MALGVTKKVSYDCDMVQTEELIAFAVLEGDSKMGQFGVNWSGRLLGGPIAEETPNSRMRTRLNRKLKVNRFGHLFAGFVPFDKRAQLL